MSKIIESIRIALADQIAEATSLLAIHELFRTENLDWLSPVDTVKRLKGEIVQAQTPEEAREILEQINHLSGPAAPDYREFVLSRLWATWEPAAAKIAGALDSAVALLSQQKANAVTAETEFFQGHGFEHEATSVSRQYDPVIASARALLGEMRQPPMVQTTVPPGAVHAAVAWLGIQLP